MPDLQIRGIKDIKLLSQYGVEFLALLKREAEGVLQPLTMPGLLDRRPDFNATIDAMIAATDRLQEIATTARRVAGASVTCVRADADAMCAHPGLASLIVTWRAMLVDSAESYVRFVEGIPDELARILVAARAGERANFMLRFDMSLDTSAAHKALEQLQAN